MGRIMIKIVYQLWRLTLNAETDVKQDTKDL